MVLYYGLRFSMRNHSCITHILRSWDEGSCDHKVSLPLIKVQAINKLLMMFPASFLAQAEPTGPAPTTALNIQAQRLVKENKLLQGLTCLGAHGPPYTHFLKDPPKIFILVSVSFKVLPF